MATIIIISIFALCVGSFLNVCIYRVPLKMSVTSPRRSFCPKCEQQLSALDNIPVLSWLFLLAKCRNCKASISGQYPLVELLSAALAVQCYLQFGLNPTGILLYVLSATLIVITFIDLEYKIIPNVISYPGMVFGLCIGIVSQYSNIFTAPVTSGALDSLLGFFAGGGFFYLVGQLYYMCTKKWGLGGGDIKLMAMTGALLGVDSIPPTIFAGSFIGAAVGILFIVVKGGGRHTEIPFGPWLALGVLQYMFINTPIFRIF